MAKLMRWTDAEIGGKVLVFDENNPVALCLLWNLVQKIEEKLYEEGINHNPFGVIGNLRTFPGVSWFLRGLCQLPQINEVVIFGEDGTGTGNAIITLWEKGLSERRTIPGFSFTIDPRIDVEAIEELRKKVKIIDRREEKKIIKVAAEFPLRRRERIFPDREKREFSPFEVPERMELPSEGTGFHFRADDVFSAWLSVINAVLRLGKRRKTRKKETIAHLFHISVIFPAGEEENIHPGFGLTKNDVETYCGFFFNPVKMPDNDYGYFERIERWGGSLEDLKDPNFHYGQREKVLERLKKASDTKRATIVLLGPKDLEELEDAPCFVLYSLSISGDRLDYSVVFRSHDMSQGWPTNMFAVLRMMREDAKELGLKPGFITVVSQNAQIYERNFERVQKVLEENGPSLSNPGRLLKFKDDSAGNFVFSVDLKEKIATARMIDLNGETLFERSHRSPRVLINFLVASFPWLSSSHILYMGQEMEKMERCLRNEEEYQQC